MGGNMQGQIAVGGPPNPGGAAPPNPNSMVDANGQFDMNAMMMMGMVSAFFTFLTKNAIFVSYRHYGGIKNILANSIECNV